MPSVPHPIAYQGSKRKIAPHILRYVPDSTERIIEPFCGSAAVSLAAAATGKVTAFVLNDLNQPLMTLWQHIIETPQSLSAAYRDLWTTQQGQERAYYDWVRDQFNATHQPHYFLYLLARCVKASVRYNANGDFNQSPDNRRKGMHPTTMQHHIIAASALLNGKVTLLSSDYRAVMDRATPTDVVYLDPPYQGVSNGKDRRYLQGIDTAAFIEALYQLNQRGIPYIVSYDGRMGSRAYGQALPADLGLHHLEIDAGRSTQATLLGHDHRTIESLYVAASIFLKIGCLA